MKCHICAARLEPWTDVRYDTDRQTFCSLDCIWKYRGKKRQA